MNPATDLIFLGVGGHAVALDKLTGTEVWRRSLKMSGYVTVRCDGESLFAGCQGEVSSLDPATGDVLWHNRLPGLGLGLVCFEGRPDFVAAARQIEDDEAAAASG